MSSLVKLSHEVVENIRDLLEKHQHARGLIISGAGEKSFVAGADISSMQNMTAEEAYCFARKGQAMTRLLENMPYPTVAAVHGFTLGGGCELALACDFIFASEQAVFAQPEVHLGLIPGFGGCVRLHKRVGVGRAKELIFTGRKVKAEEAHRLGLCDHLFPDKSALLAGADAFIRKISEKASPEAISHSKDAINYAVYGKGKKESEHEARDKGITSDLEYEAEAFASNFTTPNAKEGVAAFLEKRGAHFLAHRQS